MLNLAFVATSGFHTLIGSCIYDKVIDLGEKDGLWP